MTEPSGPAHGPTQADICKPAGSIFLARIYLLTGLVSFACLGIIAEHPAGASDNKPARSAAVSQTDPPPPEIGQGRAALPVPVNEMRDAIIAAARTGDIDELLIPIQWNELPPNFGPLSARETLARWRKVSPDGTGRERLAELINLLEAPYAVLRRGKDAENSKIYVWPAFAEIPLKGLGPRLSVELMRLQTPAEIARMKAAGGYDGMGLSIGADGVWHAYQPVVQRPERDQKKKQK